MTSQLQRKEVTSKQVASVQFGFLTDDEVRKLSVKRITSPVTSDNLGNPVADGLYDPALGPNDKGGRCTTCGLSYYQCPGHFGHIELPVPVYHPLVFTHLYKLIRHTCFHCFHFKMPKQEVDQYCERLDYLLKGDLLGAAGVSRRKARKGKALEDMDVDDLKAHVASSKFVGSPSGPEQIVITSHVLSEMHDEVNAFFKHMPSIKCGRCGASNPAVKRQGNTKLFQVYTSAKAAAQNKMRGTEIKSALGDGSTDAVAALEQDMAAALERQRKRRREDDAEDADEPEEADVDKAWDPQADDDEDEVLDDEDKADVDDEHDKAGLKADDGDVAVKDKPTVSFVDDQAERGPARKRGRTSEQLAGRGQPVYISPLDAEAAVEKLWRNEWPMLSHIYATQLGSGHHPSRQEAVQLYKIFFVRCLAVTPNKYRPPSVLGDQKFQHVQNISLQRVLNAVLELNSVMLNTGWPAVAAVAAAGETETEAAQPADGEASGAQLGSQGLTAEDIHRTNMARYMAHWMNLQTAVSGLMDSASLERSDVMGIRQQIEKKEGLFRKNMMGKRVNFAARSVISPDPYIGAGEIGVPPYFAQRLVFPEQVTPWNVEKLKQMVLNGTERYPGALAVEDEKGMVVQLANLSQQRREAISKQLLSRQTGGVVSGRVVAGPGQKQLSAGPGWGTAKTVYRNLLDGDLMLTNRQPTLHKPGLMAHRARVLKGERTIRMHYANCATFNADFDGDEINLHLPQDHLGRAEGYGIVHADQQYIVPTDGKPIRGLIQDHVVAGTLLTKRDTFLTRDEYMQLVYVGCTAWVPPGAAAAVAQQQRQLEMELPALIKPRHLWSGKQVISTVVRHFTAGMPPLSFAQAGKTPVEYWGRTSDEGVLEFYRGALVTGVMDKAQYGKYGLVHAVQELYGNTTAGQLLNALSRLNTQYLQWTGMTCGMDDLQLIADAERERRHILDHAEAVAIKTSADFVGLSVPGQVADHPLRYAAQLMEKEAEVRAKLSERYRSNAETGAQHDMRASGAMHPMSSDVIKACIPGGQAKPFPRNCMSLMTLTGAKGSLVNFSQICCLLGQQELEGRRVPRMASGKTLPCFRPYDAGARSGGFVGDRFLTGLRPQEYYFHCMAGREGLVDTAVKTSRSGYLQRCMIKNLESLRVHYDASVRDNADASIVQFAYGEDGLDVTGVSYMRRFGFLAQNAPRVAQLLDLGGAGAAAEAAGLAEEEEEVAKENRRRSKQLIKAARGRPADLDSSLPVMARHPPSVLGATSEAFGDDLAMYVERNPDMELQPTASTSAAEGDEEPGEGKKHRMKHRQQQKQQPSMAGRSAMPRDDFRRLMQLKYMRGLVAPGEAVGVLAGQSVGEPSTQMTLNTFHMAGRGEANVTLGIPRLREILMTAAPRIKTPVMTLPLRPGAGLREAQQLASSMRKVKLAEVLSGITVEERPVCRVLSSSSSSYCRSYTITLSFFNPAQYPAELQLDFSELGSCFQGKFCARLKADIAKEMKRKMTVGKISKVALSAVRGDDEAAAAGAGGKSLSPEEEEEGSSRRAPKKSDKADDFEDEDEDEENREGKLQFRGGRGEAATYDDPDEEDQQVQQAADRAIRRNEGNDDEEIEAEPPADQEEPAGPVPGTPTRGEAELPSMSEAPSAAPPKAARSRKRVGKADAAGLLTAADAVSILDAKVDTERHTCSVRVTFPLDAPKLLMLELVEAVAAGTTVREVTGIDRVYVVEDRSGGPPKVQTDGINFPGVWSAGHGLLDEHGITTNHVDAVLKTYGVEAARATILREVQSVFGAYGIGVDTRHLSLIADFMTHHGGYSPCNRIGIESSVSPFLKMSFETAAHFLTAASLGNETDNLKSPAARLCVGRVVELGTGAMDIVHQL